MFNHFQPSNYDLAIHRNVNCSNRKSTASSSSAKKRMRAAESRRCRIESPTGLAPAPTHACICLQAGQSRGSHPPGRPWGQGLQPCTVFLTCCKPAGSALCTPTCSSLPCSPGALQSPLRLRWPGHAMVFLGSGQKGSKKRRQTPRAHQGLGEAEVSKKYQSPCSRRDPGVGKGCAVSQQHSLVQRAGTEGRC